MCSFTTDITTVIIINTFITVINIMMILLDVAVVITNLDAIYVSGALIYYQYD